MNMRKVLCVGAVFSMALVSAQACSVSDEEFTDELQIEATEEPVATEELAAPEEPAGVEEFLAAEELEAVDESVATDGFDDGPVLECFEFAEPCYPDGHYVKHQCGVRCCNGALGQLQLYCGQCMPFANEFCTGRGGPRRVRWSP